MFLVGLELNVAYLKKKAMSAIAISHASIVIPFAMGTLLSLWLYPQLADRQVPFLSFSLFIGIALSITAFPVLARILTDRQLHETPVGVVALSCAAADDVTAWCLLSLVVGNANTEIGAAWIAIGGSVAFILMMFLVVRPLLNRYLSYIDRAHHPLPKYAIAMIYVLVLVAASITETIGIHAIFGAFLLGVIIPSQSGVAQNFLTKLKEPVTVLLLPAFFCLHRNANRDRSVDGWVSMDGLSRDYLGGDRRQVWRRVAGGSICRRVVA